MTSSQYISVRETAQILDISEKKVMELIEGKKLQAYRIADKFLRLKKSEVHELKEAGSIAREINNIAFSPTERISDFFYFNDFYLLSFLIISTLLIVIFYT